MPESDAQPAGRAARQPGRFRCLRCGAEFELLFTPGRIEERSCPECESNSVRGIKEPPTDETESKQ